MADDLDLEEELLQVAGRSRGAASRKRGRGKRATSDDDESSEDLLASDSDDDGRSKKNKKKQSSSKKQRGRAASDDDEDEEVDEDGYGSDLYKDEADRERLEAMTELEREMILAERAEERDKARQRKEILKKARETDKAEQHGQRLSSRQKKAASEKESRKFEAARKRQGKDSKSSRSRKGHGSDDGSEADDDDDAEEEYLDSDEGDDDDEEEEEEEEPRPARRPTTRAAAGSQPEERGRDAQQAARLDDEDDDRDAFQGTRRQAYDGDDDGLDADGGHEGGVGDHGGAGHMDDDENADHSELRAIQLTRSQLEAMCDKPFFEGEGLTGALVRMAYGPPTYDQDGKPVTVYWMMQIASIKDSTSSYLFGEKQTPCFKKLELRDGTRKARLFPMTTVSNQPLEDHEIDRWARHAGRVGDRSISKQQAAEIKSKIHEAINYRWDSVKVKEVLARKRDAGMLPVNAAAEKSRLQRLLEGEKAAAVPDVDKIAELEVKLQSVDEQIKKSAIEKRSGMATLNQRNKEANFNQTIRNVSNKPTYAPERKGGTADPFSRRVTRPNIYWNTKKDGDAQISSIPVKAPAATAAPKLKASMARMDPADLVKRLDIDIDITPLQDNSVMPPLHLRILGPRWQQGLAHHFNADLSGLTLLTVQDWQSRANTNE